MLKTTAALAAKPSQSAAVLPMPRLAESRRSVNSSLISPVVVRGVVRGADFALAAAIGVAIAALYVSEPAVAANPRYLATVGVTSLAAVGVFQLLGLYTSQVFSSIMRQLPRLFVGWTAAFGLLATALFFLKVGHELSRVWLALWFGAGFVALAAARIGLAALIKTWARQGRLYRRAVIYGAGEVTEDLIRQLETDAGTDVRIAGIFDDRGDGRVSRTIGGYRRLGGLTDLVEIARTTRVDLVIVALPVAGEKRLADVVNKLSVLPADIKLPATATSIRFSSRTYSHVGSVAMIDLYDKPIADWGTVSKWMFDKAVGLAALVVLAPVMAAVAIAIKLDSKGPVFFRQKRYGFNNELIEVLKFRSMYVDRCDLNASKLVTKDDPRVTPVGRFIRKTSLDELPQLFNVLMGDLSLVGPRPHALAAKAANRLYDEVVEGYFARHKVKPGITGWAQINGWRGETDTPDKITKRVEHDLYYVENWSVMLDLLILFKTPLSLFRTEYAY
jgi:Undecaprenyl-phosphate glucose phosphotransferase